MTRSTAPATMATPASTWITLLAGPTIWYVYFWVVYLLAECVCQGGGLDFALGGVRGLSVVTILITFVASAIILVAALRSYLVWKGSGDAGAPTALAFAALVLNALFFLAVLATGLPALGLISPC